MADSTWKSPSFFLDRWSQRGTIRLGEKLKSLHSIDWNVSTRVSKSSEYKMATKNDDEVANSEFHIENYIV